MPADKIVSRCQSFPPLTAHAEWLALFSAAVGITQAKAAYGRWISGGAKVAELPAGVARPLGKGPGTELAQLFKQLGIVPTAGCGCAEFQARMDAWKPEGCRENREEILTFLRAKYDEASVLDKLRAGTLAVANGLPLSLDGMLDLAIERAEKSSLENA